MEVPKKGRGKAPQTFNQLRTPRNEPLKPTWQEAGWITVILDMAMKNSKRPYYESNPGHDNVIMNLIFICYCFSQILNFRNMLSNDLLHTVT